MNTLLAISPIDGRYHNRLEDYRSITSEFGLMRFRLMVEIRWLIHLANEKHIVELKSFSDEQLQNLVHLYEKFNLEDASLIKSIEEKTNHDVKSVEYFINQKLKELHLEYVIPFVHFGCTSEDINNLAYALMIQQASKKLVKALSQLYQILKNLSQQHAKCAMLSRTHGQTASPTTMGKEIAVWANRLHTQAAQLKKILIYGKFNGAVGNFNAHFCAYPNLDWALISQKFIEQFGFANQKLTTQIEPHDYIAEFNHNCIRINNILMDLSRDFWGYISLNYFKQKSNSDEVGSSTMPHKINPIDFENAEGNLGMSNAIYTHLAEKLPISRYQRDLSDSTVIRNLGASIAHMALAVDSLKKGLSKIQINQAAIQKDLSCAWSVLAEPIQTMMRKHGKKDAYEQLKAFTRGHEMDEKMIKNFIDALDIPSKEKKQLAKLCPNDYIGIASQLVQALPESLDE